MLPLERSGAANSNSVAKIFTAVDPALIKVRSARLDDFLNGTVLPFVGFHGTLIGLLILSAVDPYLFTRLSPIFIALSAALALVGSLRLRMAKGQMPRQVPAASFCFLLIPLFGLPWDVGRFGFPYFTIEMYLAVLLYWSMLFLVYRGTISSSELIFPSIYVSIGAYIFWWHEPWVLSALVFVFCFIPGMTVLWGIKRLQHSVGLLLGGALLLVGELDRGGADDAAVMALVILFVAAIVIYELFVGVVHHSSLRHFMSQGLAVLLILLAVVLLLNDAGVLLQAWCWVALVSLYSLGMSAMQRRSGRATRYAWVLIAALAAVWVDGSVDILAAFNFWTPMTASLLLVLALTIGARALHNGFVHNLARLLALVMCLVVYFHVQMIQDDALGPLEARLSTQADGEASGDVAELVDDAARRLAWPVSGAWMVVVLTFATGVVASAARSYPRPIPWWRGIVRARHAVVARRSMQAIQGQVQSAPFVGQAINILKSVLGVLRYLKGDGRPITLGDLTFVGVNVFAGIVTAMLLRVSLLPWFADQNVVVAILSSHRAGFVAAWVAWGVVLSVWGELTQRTLLVFLGAGFVAVPLVEFMALHEFPSSDATFLAVLLMACGLPLFVLGILRRQTGGHAPYQAPPHPSKDVLVV